MFIVRISIFDNFESKTLKPLQDEETYCALSGVLRNRPLPRCPLRVLSISENWPSCRNAHLVQGVCHFLGRDLQIA